jgi:urea transport system substrate-binding protein
MGLCFNRQIHHLRDGQFEIVWSSEKPIRPEAYPSSRSMAAWKEFLAGLYK